MATEVSASFLIQAVVVAAIAQIHRVFSSVSNSRSIGFLLLLTGRDRAVRLGRSTAWERGALRTIEAVAVLKFLHIRS